MSDAENDSNRAEELHELREQLATALQRITEQQQSIRDLSRRLELSLTSAAAAPGTAGVPVPESADNRGTPAPAASSGAAADGLTGQILDVFVACGDVFNPYQTVKRRMLDWMKRQELSGNCSARDRFRSCRRNQDGEEVAGQALHLQCLGGVHFNLLKENKNFQTQNTVLVAHIQEQELRMLSADKPGDWDLHLPKAMATYNGTSHSQLGDSPADFLLKQKHGGVSVPLVSVERQSCWRPGNPSFAPFEVGQLVKRETQRPGNLLTGKFEQRFDGPFKVKSRNSNDVTYTLERDTGAELRAHHTQLRPWITAPSYLRRLEEVREDGEGRGCSMHPPLPAEDSRDLSG
ncbi:hypothetical protein FJT64_005678 [Amphibalanus amphitrite]|uniref:Integrase catalytic domain-containing protein n=1 Tax=Amphibalanus amphitrite TaxID=1232801 RepID=A0A6A4W4G7_AMPAM|nr:hypothetical protein FJT64_005678 [Amphibalanus amphitrite]